MDSTIFAGKRVNLKGDGPEKGETAPDFTFVTDSFEEMSLYDYEAKVKVLLAVPSLETGVCQMETRKFNEKLGSKPGVIGLVISKDLPFVMKRFCATEGIENVSPASDYRYNDFCSEYNTEMIDGPWKGLSARAVFVLDSENKVQYSELVPSIGQEPDYDSAMKAVESLLA